MVQERSEWRLGDAAAYERAMATAELLLARLLHEAREGDLARRSEAAEVRRSATMLDGFDRTEIDELCNVWSDWLKDLGVEP